MKVIDKTQLNNCELTLVQDGNSILKVLNHPYAMNCIENIETRKHIYIISDLYETDLFSYM